MEKTYMASLIAKEGTGKEIQEVINQISVQNYSSMLEGILSYDAGEKATTTLERKFLREVDNKFSEFCKNIMYVFYKDFSKERLIECILECNMKGIYYYDSYADNGERECFIVDLDMEEQKKVDMLKDFLTATLDTILNIESKERSEAAIAEKERQINVTKFNINRYEIKLREEKAKLAELSQLEG